VREITSLDSKLPDQTEVHIRTDLSSHPLSERNRSHSSRSLFAQWRADAVAEKPSSMITVSWKTGTV